MSFFYVAIGGFFGSILRYYISIKMNKRNNGTWIANITGAMLLALFVYFHATNQIPESLWFILGIGFCGSYTTFSTFGNEILQLLLQKKYWQAIAYVACSLIISFVVVFLILTLLGYKF